MSNFITSFCIVIFFFEPFMVVEDRQEHEPGDLGHSYQFILEFKYEYGMIENRYGKNKKI